MKLDDDLITEVQNQLREVDGQDIPFEQRRVKMQVHLSNMNASDRLAQWFADNSGEINREGGHVLHASLHPDNVFALRTNPDIERISLWVPKAGFPRVKVLAVTAVVMVVAGGLIVLMGPGTDEKGQMKNKAQPEVVAPSNQTIKESVDNKAAQDTDKQVVGKEVLYSPKGYGEKVLARAESLYDRGRFDEALVALTKASRLMPENGKVWFELAMTLVHMDRKGEALGMMEKAINRDPNNVAYLKHAAMTCMELNLNEKARNYFEEILKMNPGDQEARSGLEMIQNVSPRSRKGRKD